MSLSTKALLVNLALSQWAGRKLDRKASGSVENNFATAGHVGNYNKKLLPGAFALEEIHKATGAMRKFFIEQTLPWLADGTRIISAKNYLDFVREYGKRKSSREKLVTDFLNSYPNLVKQAEVKLGALFNGAEYPQADDLRSAFSCEIAFFPLPAVADFRVSIDDTEKAAFVENMRKVESKAMRDCWERLHGVVSKAAATLSQPDAVFRDTLLTNVTELCALLPKLNVTDDAQLEAMRIEVERTLSSTAAADVRKSATERSAAAQSLADITSKMNSIMGGGL